MAYVCLLVDYSCTYCMYQLSNKPIYALVSLCILSDCSLILLIISLHISMFYIDFKLKQFLRTDPEYHKGKSLENLIVGGVVPKGPHPSVEWVTIFRLWLFLHLHKYVFELPIWQMVTLFVNVYIYCSKWFLPIYTNV